MLPLLYALTLLASALLLFSVQPMVGKMLLPLLGGTPGVWNTCLVFFQAVLLAGYLYSHLSTTWLGARRQAILHVVVLALPLLALPIAVRADLVPQGQDDPVGGLLLLLLTAVGLPFFVVSTSGPLLQRWFAATGHRSARDPYFLYAASNVGSLAALLAYPFAVEPTLPLAEQRSLWAMGYAVFALLVVVCAGGMWCSPHPPAPSPTEGGGGARTEGASAPSPVLLPSPLGGGGVGGEGELRRLRWVALAFVPSSLLMAVTTHITTNLAPVPLLWVVPLALYLLSFILVFARWPGRLHRALGRALPMAVLFLTFALLVDAAQPVGVVMGLHLGTFLVVALVCHGELAKDRPAAAHLTEFYLWLSVGGVLGGLFNALFAPLVFRHAGLVEYPLVLAAATLVRPGRAVAPGGLQWADLLRPAALGLLTAAVVLAVRNFGGPLPTAEGFDAVVRNALAFGLPVVLAYTLVDRPVRYALGIAALFLAGGLGPGPLGRTLLTERNFFGVVRVTESPDGRFVRLVHGTTLHGQQRVEAGQQLRRLEAAAGALAAAGPLDATVIGLTQPLLREWIDREPLTYYHRLGPVGQVFASRPAGFRSVGVVGLGAGAVAAYAKPGQRFVFYEIDPAVARIARDPAYFTFLARSPAETEVVLGDARLELARASGERFDLIILDAFSSDAIPVHLLTREALRLYLGRLADGGILAVHASNSYLDLPPLLARLAADADPPLSAHLYDDRWVSEEALAEGKSRSQWVVLARRPEDLGRINGSPYWPPVLRWEQSPLWTDDYSHLLGAWRREE